MVKPAVVSLPAHAAEQEEATATRIPDTLAGLWRPRFPSAAKIEEAADFLPSEPCGRVQEGPSWRISVSPGSVRIWTKDEADAERRENDELDRHAAEVDAQAAFMQLSEDSSELLSDVPDRLPTRVITEFSAKSRARMTRRLTELDYAPLFEDPTRLPCVVTVTYPRCWLRVAPTGRDVKKHLDRLRKRYERAFGERLACVWKLEFQARGLDARCDCEHCKGRDDGRAPHVHFLMCAPHRTADGKNFREWLSETWADIVDHPDPKQRELHRKAGTNVGWRDGLRCTDPKRVAVYFTKHSSATGKEYQHYVPEAWQEPGKGPGRFWGYWELKPKIATRSTSVDVGTQAGRIVRRVSRAQQVTREVRRPRAKGGVPRSKYAEVQGLAGKLFLQSRRVRYRKTRVRAVRLKNGRGWLSVNDGAQFATELAVALRLHLAQRQGERMPSGFRGWSKSLTDLSRSVDTEILRY